MSAGFMLQAMLARFRMRCESCLNRVRNAVPDGFKKFGVGSARGPVNHDKLSSLLSSCVDKQKSILDSELKKLVRLYAAKCSAPVFLTNSFPMSCCCGEANLHGSN